MGSSSGGAEAGPGAMLVPYATFALLICAWAIVTRARLLRGVAQLSGPPHTFVRGALRAMRTAPAFLAERHTFLCWLHEVYGPIASLVLPFGGGAIVCCATAETARDEVLSDWRAFPNRPRAHDLPRALASIELGAEWKARRAVVAHAFSRAALAARHDATMVHALRLGDAFARGAAEASAAVEVCAPVRAAVLDALAEMVFGLPDFGALVAGRRSVLATATDQFARASARTSHLPPALVAFLDAVPARWHPLRARRQLAAALRALNALAGDAYDDAADEARAVAEAQASAARAARARRRPAAPAPATEPEADGAGADPAADALIALLARARVPRAEACELALGLLVHARESTAHTVCWALNLLARNPTAQAAARAELVAAGAQLRAAQLEALPLLRAVWLEALRLHPTVPFIERVAGPGARLGGAALPSGARVCYSLAAAARAEGAGGQDARAFRPSRFLDPASGALRADAGAAWMPYGAGPRRCAGERLAEGLGLALLASVLRRFELSAPTPASDVPVESTLDGTLAPSDDTGLRVGVSPLPTA